MSNKEIDKEKRKKDREKRRQLEKKALAAEQKNTSNINKNNDENPALQVAVRNLVAYSNYRKMISLTILNLFVLLICIITAYNFYSKPVPPRYIPISADGKVIPDIPLNKPNMNDGAIMEFALNAVRDVNMYDYANWQTQISNAMEYFTITGWNSYLLEFEKSKTINTVKKNRMVVNMQPTAPPSIIRQGELASNGVYVWIVEIPTEIRYISNVDSTTKTNPINGVTRLTIIRTPTIDNPAGVGIQIYQFDTSRRTSEN